MGLFSKKKKTTTEKINKKITLNKIIKFSYLQTLAVNGGLVSAKEIAGETEAKENTINDEQIKKSNLPVLAEQLNLNSSIFGDLPPGIGEIANSLFGKKTTKSTTINTKETGWSVSKIWNQPQFDIIRYAIGIKELSIDQFSYEQVSEIISIPWASPKEIIKVSLVADQYIPSIFPPGNYITYYIKANIENADWIQINPLGSPSVFKEDGSIVPRIINFNTEKPLSSRLEEVYFNTSEIVKEIVFRAVLSRPETIEGQNFDPAGYSPILKSYRLLMSPRNGL